MCLRVVTTKKEWARMLTKTRKSTSIRCCSAMASVLLSVALVLGCGDGGTEPKIAYPIPDLTGTWRVDVSAPGTSNSNLTFEGVAELRLTHSDGVVGGEYVVLGKVVNINNSGVRIESDTLNSAGLMLNGLVSWGVQEDLDPSPLWRVDGDLQAYGLDRFGELSGGVMQLHVSLPTQLELGAFKFHIVDVDGYSSALEFVGSGRATRIPATVNGLSY